MLSLRLLLAMRIVCRDGCHSSQISQTCHGSLTTSVESLPGLFRGQCIDWKDSRHSHHLRHCEYQIRNCKVSSARLQSIQDQILLSTSLAFLLGLSTKYCRRMQKYVLVCDAKGSSVPWRQGVVFLEYVGGLCKPRYGTSARRPREAGQL